MGVRSGRELVCMGHNLVSECRVSCGAKKAVYWEAYKREWALSETPFSAMPCLNMLLHTTGSCFQCRVLLWSWVE